MENLSKMRRLYDYRGAQETLLSFSLHHLRGLKPEKPDRDKKKKKERKKKRKKWSYGESGVSTLASGNMRSLANQY